MYLGDLVEAALISVGITKERVTRFLGKPCGCEERKEKLNILDRWARMTMQKGLKNAGAYFDRIVKFYEDDGPVTSEKGEKDSDRDSANR
jgi:hypothetical protein